MRVKKWTGLMLMVVIAAGLVFAEAEQGPKRRGEGPQRVQRPAAARRAGSVQGREQMYRERMAKLAVEHQAAIRELLDIKKIAEEENAERTAEAIQTLIDRKNAEYQKSVEQLERTRQERTKKLERRREQTKAQRQQDRSGNDGNGQTSGDSEND